MIKIRTKKANITYLKILLLNNLLDIKYWFNPETNLTIKLYYGIIYKSYIGITNSAQTSNCT